MINLSLTGAARSGVVVAALFCTTAPLTAQEICKVLLDKGIRDTQITAISERRFDDIRKTVCTKDYEKYADAIAKSGGGDLNVPGYFEISGQGGNTDSEYREKLKAFCEAAYNAAMNNNDLRRYTSNINEGILKTFDHCVDVATERFIRYVQPNPDGSSFYIILRNKISGIGSFEIRTLTLLDTTTNKKLDPAKDCDFPYPLPFNTAPYSVHQILCSKVKDHDVVVNAITSLGPIDPVAAPAVRVFQVGSELDQLRERLGRLRVYRKEATEEKKGIVKAYCDGRDIATGGACIVLQGDDPLNRPHPQTFYHLQNTSFEGGGASAIGWGCAWNWTPSNRPPPVKILAAVTCLALP